MNAIIILIPVTLALIGFATALFFWAVRHDQFQDLDTPAILPLMDDVPAKEALIESALPQTNSPQTTEKHA